MPSPVKSQILAVAPKFTAFLSICGSLGIVVKVLNNPARRKKTMHRIVTGMSICDILASIWYFTGTWAIPAGTLSWFGDSETETVFWAAGDSEGVSCSFAGFFNQFAVATPLYNTTLAIYYLLVVNYGWRDSRVAKIEWLFHAIPVGYALISSTFAVATNLYGHVEWTCWILPSETAELTTIQSKFQVIQWLFLFGVVWSCIIIVSIVFGILYFKMKSLERSMRRYSYSSTVTNTYVNGSAAFSTRAINSNEETQYNVDSSLQDNSGYLEKNEPKSDTPPERRLQSDGEEESEANIDVEEGKTNEIKIQDVGGEDNDKIDLNTDFGEDDIIQELNSGAVIENEPNGIEKKVTLHATDTTNLNVSTTVSQEVMAKQRPNMPFVNFQRNSVNRDRQGYNYPAHGRRTRIEVSKSQKIAVQGLLYVGAFYITWTFPTVSRITELIAKRNYFPIQFLDTVLLPLQGFLNFLIYVRPRFLLYRRSHPDKGFWTSVTVVVTEIKID